MTDPTTEALVELALDVLADDDAAVPARVGTRLLERTGAVRANGWDTGEATNALAVFIRTAAELSALLDGLDADDWLRSTRVQGESVAELVQHLVGMERYALGQLGQRAAFDAPRPEDHHPATLHAARDVAGAPGPVLAAAWWAEAMRLFRAAGELGPEHAVLYHHLGGSLRGFLVVRTFELWSHDDDIRDATGRPPNELEDERLSLMTRELMGAFALGMALSGTAQPGRTARLVLTGAGGGQFDVSLAPGERAGEPDITITTSALGLCRVASRRLAPGDLELTVGGDAALLEPVLVGVGAFALD